MFMNKVELNGERRGAASGGLIAGPVALRYAGMQSVMVGEGSFRNT